MAKVIRKHWLAIVLNVLILTGVVAALLWSQPSRTGGPVAAAAPSAGDTAEALSALDGVGHAQLSALREDLCLTAADLAALGCQEESAEALLRGLRAWFEAERQAVDEVRTRERSARSQLRDTYQAMHVGPRDEVLIRTIPLREAELRLALEQRQLLVDRAAAAVAPHLSASQAQAWATARANAQARVPLSYRYAPALTAQQTTQINIAFSRGDISAAERALLMAQRAEVSRAWTNSRLAAEAVDRAEQRVLPMPEEMRAAWGSDAVRSVGH